jgi:hypothetical protein
LKRKINILGVANGVGLEKDYNIIKSILEPYYDIYFIDFDDKQANLKTAYLNIYLEKALPKYLKLAQKNIFIPNPEWYFFGEKILQQFDYVLAKTRDTEEIFNRLKANVIYTSFTSEDKYMKLKKKPVFIHSPGKSETKGSDTIWDCWCKHQDLAQLIFCRINHFEKYFQQRKNISKCFFRFDDKDFRILQNTTLFHLCTSEYEGWGHYIHEAKSTGAVVITTDAPPMSDFVDRTMGALVRVYSRRRLMFGIKNMIAEENLYRVVKECQEMPEWKTNQMSEASRQSFLDNDKFFRDKFLQTINQIME